MRMSKGRKYSLGLTLWLATIWKRFLLVSPYFVCRLFITNPAVIYPQETVVDSSWMCVATGQRQVTLSCTSNLPGRTERTQSRLVSCHDPREHPFITELARNVGKNIGGLRVSPLGNCWNYTFKIWPGVRSGESEPLFGFFLSENYHHHHHHQTKDL